MLFIIFGIMWEKAYINMHAHTHNIHERNSERESGSFVVPVELISHLFFNGSI